MTKLEAVLTTLRHKEPGVVPLMEYFSDDSAEAKFVPCVKTDDPLERTITQAEFMDNYMVSVGSGGLRGRTVERGDDYYIQEWENGARWKIRTKPHWWREYVYYPMPLSPSGEQMASIIAALSGGPAGRFIVNIPNERQVSNLPIGAVVECFASIDRFGIHPEFFGPLPLPAQAVCAWHLREMALTMNAAVTGDRLKAVQALCLDPAVTDWNVAEKLLDELIEGTSDYLPQFK